MGPPMHDRNLENADAPARRDLLRGAVGALIGSVSVAGAASAPGQIASNDTIRGDRRRALIDPGTAQVLFVDLQASLVAQSRTATPKAIETAAGVLAQVAQILKLPSLFSVVPEGSKPPRLIARLSPYSTPANTLLRKPAGALMDAPTERALARTRRSTLFIAGYAAEVAVLHAALDAIAAGYTVYYVVDCIGSSSPRTEAATFRELDLAGATPTSVLSLTTRLAPDFSSSPGSETFAALAPILKQ